MSPVLAGLAGLFVFAAAWEAMGMRSSPRFERAVRILPFSRLDALRDVLVARLDVEHRLIRAGLAGRTTPRRFVAAKLGGSIAGLASAILVAPVAPSRLVPILIAALAVCGFMGPDAWAERIARRRRAALLLALPDALDLVAVGVATGRSPVALFSEIATGAASPLASELAISVAEIQAGARQSVALAGLRRRTGAPELGAVADALERSRRYGSPLAEELHAQAATLRARERRAIEERAARAAPKIQLVVAMVLVPSALLAIAAALVAYSGELFSAF